MLDFRIHTFLELCRLRNYTRTAESLHITQPAVTQHIHYLEREFGIILFERSAKKLTLTSKGEAFYRCAMSMEANSRRIHELMEQPEHLKQHYKFGVSLTIGEYMIPRILADYLKEYPGHQVEMLVENTDLLMKSLDKGELDFAIIEGSFDKRLYSHRFFSNERFLAVCAAAFPAAGRELEMDELVQYPFIIREKGSGTRMILENILKEHNLSLEQFNWVSEIGNFQTIKHLVKNCLGITFLYEPVVREELKDGIFKEVPLNRFSVRREFNFVYLKDSIFEKDYLTFYDFCTKEAMGSI